ncbi:MAG: hypothetical protein KC964_18410, partial [Candidatus Omnitrophica bacterium]|nr:hypothetical protein [Candidatus Omnitrophota bacterium]
NLKIDYPDFPDFPDPPDDQVFSPSLGIFQTLEPLPPPPSPKGRQAQEEVLRRFGFDPSKIRRPPIEELDEVNKQGFIRPIEEGDLYNERR